MKRVLIALLFILAWAITASATQITVSSYAVSNWQYGGTAGKLRIFCNRSFQTSDGRQVNQGSPDQSGGFYLEVSVSVSGTTATIASFTIDSTTDGINTTAARYTAYFYTTDGRRLGPFGQFSNFFISPDSGASQTWTIISLYNYNQAAPPDLRFTYDDATIERRIASINGLSNPLTTTGDIIIATTGGALMRLGIGSTNQFLGVTGGLPAWQSLTSSQITTALTYTPLNKAGDTMTGALTLSGAPTLSLHAATKAYVDGKVGNIAQINLDSTANQTFTVASSFSELFYTDDLAGDHKLGLSGPIGVTHGGTGLATIASGSIPYASALNTLSALSITGSSNRVLRSNGSVPSWAQVVLTTDVSGILPSANGGTNNAFFAITGPASTVKTYTFPNANATILTSANLVTAAQGGTGFGTGVTYTAGDIIYATGATALAKLALGSANTVLHGGASAPAYSAVDIANDTTGTLTLARGGTGQTGFTAGYIKSTGSALTSQAVPFPIADGGTNTTGSGYVTNGLFVYTGSAFSTTAAGTTGTVLTGNTGSAPTFASSPTLTGLTLTGIAAASNNSLVYANTSGALGADNTKLIWDSLNSRLSVNSVLRLLGSTSGNVDLQAPSTGGGLVITLPATEGSLDQGLKVTASSAGAMTLGYFTPLTAAVTSINGQNNTAQLLTIANTGSSLTVAQASDNENQIRIPSAGSAISAGLITNGTQSLDGIKTLLATLHLRSGDSTNPAAVFDCSTCALTASPVNGALEYDGASLRFTIASPSTSRKTVAFTDSNITGSAASISGNLTGDVTSVGMATTYAGVVPLSKGGLGNTVVMGAAGTFLATLDGSTVSFTSSGSTLTGLNASNLASGTISATILGNSNALQTSDIGATSSAKAVAGLTNAASPKLNLANMQEVMAVTDLSTYATESGTGTVAIRATFTSLTANDILTWNGTDWINQVPGAATAHNLLSATHSDTSNTYIDGTAVGGTTVSQGDLLIGNGTPKWARLLIGSAGTHLRSTGITAAWSLVQLSTDVSGTLAIANGGTGQTTKTTAFDALSPNTSKGDITVHNGTNNVRMGVGANNTLPVADSAQANGIKWAAVDLASSMVTGILPTTNSWLNSVPAGAYRMLPVSFTDNASGTSGGGTGGLMTTLQVRVMRFRLDERLTVNKIGFGTTSAGSGGTLKVGIGIYNNSGSLIIDTGPVTPVTNTYFNQTPVTGAGTTLEPGYYYLGWTVSGTTVPTFVYTGSLSGFQSVANQGTVQIGKNSVNAAVAGQLPSTLATITGPVSGAYYAVPVVKLQN